MVPPVQCAGFCTQNSGLWIHGHRDLLKGMASIGWKKEVTLQSQHRSHQSCLRKTKVKAQLKSSAFWGLTQWWSSSDLLVWWVGQWCPQQSRMESTGEGLGKRQGKLIPFFSHAKIQATHSWRRTKVTKESWVPKCILQEYLGCQGKCLTHLLVSQQFSKW